MSDNYESPTTEHLSDLRAVGLFPNSPLASRMAGALAVLSVLGLSKGTVLEATKASQALLAADDLSLIYRSSAQLGVATMNLVSTSVLAAIAATWLIHLIQSRFYLRIGPVEAQARVALLALSPPAPLGIPILCDITITVLATVTSWWIFASFVPGFLAAVDSDPLHVAPIIGSLVGSIAFVLAIVGATGAILAWLGARFWFMLRHRIRRSGLGRRAF